jgi:uncharacterized small protein (DUF1192 family)
VSDIVFDGMVFDRLREIGDQSDRIAALESEIARLRLTDEEREAVEDAVSRYVPGITPRAEERAATLRGLLERLTSNYPAKPDSWLGG